MKTINYFSNIISKNNTKQLLLILAFLSVFVLIYLLNTLFPLFADDWNYSYVFGVENLRISSFSDVIRSQYNHYLLWGGRTVVHAIAQILLMFDFSWICIINAFAFTIFTYALYKIANIGNKVNPALFVLINLLVWFFQPAFCATVLWKTGSANYLWGTLIIVLFIYPYYSYYRSKKTGTGLTKLVLFFISGIIAGWTNENMSVALIFFIILSFILFRYEKISIPNWAVSGLIGVVIGCAFMLLAPGNYVRLEVIQSMYAEDNLTRYDITLSVLKDMLRYLRRYILILSGVYLLLLFIYKKYYRESSVKQTVVRSSLLFLLTGLMAFLIMIASPSFPERALFGIIILFLIPIGILCANIDFSTKYLRIATVLSIIILIVIFSFRYYKTYTTLDLVSEIWREREIYLEKQKEQGIDSIVFTKTFNVRSKYFIHDFSSDPENWENVSYARFYGIRKVTVVADNEDEKK